MPHYILTKWVTHQINPILNVLVPALHVLKPKTCLHITSQDATSIAAGDLLICEVDCGDQIGDRIEKEELGVKLNAKNTVKLALDVYRYCQDVEAKRIVETTEKGQLLPAFKKYVEQIKKKEPKFSTPRYGLHELT